MKKLTLSLIGLAGLGMAAATAPAQAQSIGFTIGTGSPYYGYSPFYGNDDYSYGYGSPYYGGQTTYYYGGGSPYAYDAGYNAYGYNSAYYGLNTGYGWGNSFWASGKGMSGHGRANAAAGSHGMDGRTNAMMRQRSSGDITTGSVGVRSNRGGAMQGLDRADAVAGTNGQKGRMNARKKQMMD